MRHLALRNVGGSSAAAITLLLLSATMIIHLPRVQAQTECTAAIDFMLVLDGSESISAEDFNAMRSFAGGLVGHFSFGPDDARTGIVQFASQGQGVVETGLSNDRTAVDAAISGMTQLIGGTDIQEGIALSQTELTAGGRSGVPHVAIVLTDGEHNQPGDPVAEAEAGRALGTEIFAIAVGPGPDMAQLAAIASDPDSDHIFSVSDFDALATILEPLVLVVCPPTPEAHGEATATPYGPPVLGAGPVPPSGLPETGGLGATTASDPAGYGTAMALGGLGIAMVLATASYWIRRRATRQ